MAKHHPKLPDPLRKRCDSFAKRTHCPEGHPLTPKNTIYEKRGKYTSRRCRACRRKQQKESYQAVSAVLRKMKEMNLPTHEIKRTAVSQALRDGWTADKIIAAFCKEYED
jgi:hypothetical protein